MRVTRNALRWAIAAAYGVLWIGGVLLVCCLG